MNTPAVVGESARLKDAKLTRAKRSATGLLVAAGLLYVAATLFTPRYPLLAYLAATCEAAMVGALADWFAVVALFRHPLNIPLPHTAILPKNKARIAQGLGDFIQEQFLSTPALVGKIREFDHLKVFLSTPTTDGAYDAVAEKLEIAADSVAVKVHRLRQRYGELIRAEIAQTVASPADIEEELGHLFDAVGR